MRANRRYPQSRPPDRQLAACARIRHSVDMGLVDPGDLAEPNNWTGGWYELAIELGQRDDERLGHGLTMLWNLAGIQDCKALVSRDPYRLVDAPLTTASLEQHQLLGAVRVPSSHKVVCAITAVRGDNGPDWLDFGLPLGALAWTDERIGGFPFDPDGGPASLAWRSPIDDWMSSIALNILHTLGLALALIGFEVLGQLRSEEVANQVPEPRHFGIVLPGAFPEYQAATA